MKFVIYKTIYIVLILLIKLITLMGFRMAYCLEAKLKQNRH